MLLHKLKLTVIGSLIFVAVISRRGHRGTGSRQEGEP